MDNLELEAQILYDYPFSGFNMHLIEDTTEVNKQFQEEGAVQKPLYI